MNIWIGTMVTIMSVCAVFVTVSPLLNYRKVKKIERKVKEIEHFLSKTIKSTEEYNFVLKLLKREDTEIEVWVKDKKTKEFIYLKCPYKNILFENDKFYLLKDMRKEEITTFLNYTNNGGFITVDSDFIKFYKNAKTLILKNK